MDAVNVCEVLAARRPTGAVPALHAAAENPYVAIQRPALGALAMLGENNALTRTRQFAKEGEAQQRADAIHWLALCKDHASGPFLKAALLDEDPVVRDAATEALKTLASGNANRR
jgi:HEAT repeat protein